ncbi:hypothetical protein DXG01_016606, partial [Tephrocybe rancida]
MSSSETSESSSDEIDNLHYSNESGTLEYISQGPDPSVLTKNKHKASKKRQAMDNNTSHYIAAMQGKPDPNLSNYGAGSSQPYAN